MRELTPQMFVQPNNITTTTTKLADFFNSDDQKISFAVDGDNGDHFPTRISTDSANTRLFIHDSTMMTMSPAWNNQSYPFMKSPWFSKFEYKTVPRNALIGSLVREEGHVYSLATSGELLYTGSESKNIRVWKNHQEFTGFKSNSGLVKAIIISGEKIFTGHQDGKIRIWKVSPKNDNNGVIYKRTGTLPTLKDVIISSINPQNYVVVGRNRSSSLWFKHSDAVSCLCLSQDKEILYSSSWDTTLKVWRISDSKCLESVTVHEDAVNSIATASYGLVITGSADGTAKVWRRHDEVNDGITITKHTLVQTLLKQNCAVTAVAVNSSGSMVYCGSSDGLVNFWEREKLLTYGGVLKGHKLAVLCLAAAGNNMVFSGGADKTICVWRREGLFHTCLAVLKGHTGPVKCLAVEEDKQSSEKGDRRWIVYSGSLDKSVKVWGVWDGVGVV